MLGKCRKEGPITMNAPITITEVIGRSEQGMTRPFLCHANDWGTYYVKGAYAGKSSLCCEWVGSSLARMLVDEEPLSLPWFRMAEVPQELVDGSARSDIRDLGVGRVFASRRIDGGQELDWLAAQGWPDGTMAMILLMDLWLQNEDRSLSPMAEIRTFWWSRSRICRTMFQWVLCGRIRLGENCCRCLISIWLSMRNSTASAFSEPMSSVAC